MSSIVRVPADSREIYGTIEFDRWIDRTDLDADERFVIEKYLSPRARTLEAGTGGGRILLAVRQMGFTDLTGFDFVPGLIEKARAADRDGRIRFDVQDAGHLDYPGDSFDQLLYLQQLLSCIDDDGTRGRAVREAFRVLRPGGVAIFSVLCLEVRRRSPLYRVLIAYWAVSRFLRGSRAPVQAMPWMRLGDRFNPGAMLDRKPYVYWFRAAEIVAVLQNAGFRVCAVGSRRQIEEGGLCDGLEQLSARRLDGAVYCVCTKPGAGSADRAPIRGAQNP